MNYMGVDIGSSGCKALAVDENGRQLAKAFREYELKFTADGGAILDPDEVIGKCFEVIKECAGRTIPGSIKGIGISSQGEAFTAVGDNNEYLSQAMVSSDIRPQSLMNEWVQKFGAEKLYRITGHTAHPMFTLFKLLWFKENEKELWKKSRYFFCFEDLLQFRLGLKPSLSWSMAGRTMMFDVTKHEWNQDILHEIGILPENLAEPLPPGSLAGIISPDIARQLHLSNDAFVVTGGHDQTCCALGAGVVEEGIAMLSTGTVECICPAFKNPIFSKALMDSNLCTYDYSIEGLYTTVAFSLTGGNILKWFKDQFGNLEIENEKLTGQNAYDLILNSLDSKPGNLLALPYFTPSGTPFFDTKTKGAIIGLQLSTKRADILKALLEGVSFEMRLNLDILENAGYIINELRLVGGGAKSNKWAQLKANVMNKKITSPDVKEAGCLGGAMLACSADTGKSIRDLVAGWIKQPAVVYPQKEYENWYNERFEVYKKLYKNVKEISI
ncbi:MAG: FGGY-family carbohydrate kinase [Ignavibacteriaceae bacterium]